MFRMTLADGQFEATTILLSEQQSSSLLAPELHPTAHIHADQPTPGKIRLISPSFDVEKDSCLLLRLASTVLSPNAASP